ncbi:hypothetical protein EYF80_012752 [Liparis tanakae]|uniref:Uncharacterized protein n=1 Tax=Liparis tanakae TaxID=230148 RepID=A0A4Z2II39_9TELE|nr:hypothetical protein EYF80_012752 [Liparis tanakae]
MKTRPGNECSITLKRLSSDVAFRSGPKEESEGAVYPAFVLGGPHCLPCRECLSRRAFPCANGWVGGERRQDKARRTRRLEGRRVDGSSASERCVATGAGLLVQGYWCRATGAGLCGLTEETSREALETAERTPERRSLITGYLRSQ